MFQFEHFIETAVGDGIENRILGGTTGRDGILRERVAGGEDDIDPNTALWSIAVILEFQSVSVQGLLRVGIIGCQRSERGQSETGSLEIYKGLKGGRGLGSLAETVNPRA